MGFDFNGGKNKIHLVHRLRGQQNRFLQASWGSLPYFFRCQPRVFQDYSRRKGEHIALNHTWDLILSEDRTGRSDSDLDDLDEGESQPRWTRCIVIPCIPGAYLWCDQLYPLICSLTDKHKNAIRMVRKIKYFVARRKFQQVLAKYLFWAVQLYCYLSVSGSKALRRAGCDWAVLARPPEHDGEDQGAAEEAGPDPGQAGHLPPRGRQEGQHQTHDHRGQALQAREPDLTAGWKDWWNMQTSGKTDKHEGF